MSKDFVNESSLPARGDAKATLLTSRFRVILSPDGKVLHVPSLDLHYSCVADLTYWPHDTHNCSLKIGSWVHSGSLIDIAIAANFTEEVPYIFSVLTRGGGRN